MRQRITPAEDFQMKLVAAGFDVIGLILVVTGVGGTVWGLFGDGAFMLWYWSKGMPVWRGRAAKRAGINFLIELVPILNNFYPGFSIFVWGQNKMVMAEDAEYNKAEEYKVKETRWKQSENARIAEEGRQQSVLEQNAINQNQQNEQDQIAA